MFNTLDMGRLAAPLARARYEQGRLAGRADALDAASRRAVALATLTEDVVASAALEGRSLDPGGVRASIAGRLGGMPDVPLDGIAEIALDAARDPAAPLTGERLRAWHAALGTSGFRRVRRGRAEETDAFLAWFEDARGAEPVTAAGLAHLRFLALSPFEDGNGPIARAVSDLALAGAEASGVRFYSLSDRIARERRAYDDALKARSQAGPARPNGWNGSWAPSPAPAPTPTARSPARPRRMPATGSTRASEPSSTASAPASRPGSPRPAGPP